MIKFMTHRILGALLIIGMTAVSSYSLAQAQAQAPERQTLDRVIAIVDEGVVLQSELDARLAEIRLQAQQSGRPLPPEEDLREQVIEALVVESLQLQFAAAVITIP